MLAGLLGGWLAHGSHYVLIPVAAGAMGLQSAAIASSGAEVATTYITGTITRGIVRGRLAAAWRDLALLRGRRHGRSARAARLARGCDRDPACDRRNGDGGGPRKDEARPRRS